MKLALAALMAIGLLALPIERAAACSCAMFGPEEAAASADVVFAGTVIDAREVALEDGPLGAVAATVPGPIAPPFGATIFMFAVDGVAKGEVGSRAEILGGGDGGMCGMFFGVDERWLVFATWDGAMLSTNLCAGNMVLAADAESPLELLPPTDAPSQADADIPLPAIAVLGIIALVVAVSWLAFRRGPDSAAS